jgi:hypothetical protein
MDVRHPKTDWLTDPWVSDTPRQTDRLTPDGCPTPQDRLTDWPQMGVRHRKTDWPTDPRWMSDTPRQTGWLNVGRKITSTFFPTNSLVERKPSWMAYGDSIWSESSWENSSCMGKWDVNVWYTCRIHSGYPEPSVQGLINRAFHNLNKTLFKIAINDVSIFRAPPYISAFLVQ